MKKIKEFSIPILLLLVILAGISLRIYYHSQKDMLHGDEVRTIGHLQWEQPLKIDFMFEHLHESMTGREIKDSLYSFDSSPTGLAKGLYKILIEELHGNPNLYYFILRIALFPLGTGLNNTYFIIALLLNLIFFILSIFLSYRILRMLGNNEYEAIAVTALIMLAPSMIAIDIIYRTYSLWRLTTLLVIYQWIKIDQRDNINLSSMNALPHYLLLSIYISIGLLSHYYAIIIFFFFLLTFTFIYRNNLKKVLAYFLSCLQGLIIAQAFYRSYIFGFVLSGRGKRALDIASDTNLAKNILSALSQLYSAANEVFGGIILVFLFAVFAIVYYKWKRKLPIYINKYFSAVFITGLLSLFTIKYLTPSMSVRYYSSIVPILLMGLTFLFVNIDQKIIKSSIIGIIVVLFSIQSFKTLDIDFIFSRKTKPIPVFVTDSKKPIILIIDEDIIEHRYTNILPKISDDQKVLFTTFEKAMSLWDRSPSFVMVEDKSGEGRAIEVEQLMKESGVSYDKEETYSYFTIFSISKK